MTNHNPRTTTTFSILYLASPRWSVEIFPVKLVHFQKFSSTTNFSNLYRPILSCSIIKKSCVNFGSHCNLFQICGTRFSLGPPGSLLVWNYFADKMFSAAERKSAFRESKLLSTFSLHCKLCYWTIFFPICSLTLTTLTFSLGFYPSLNLIDDLNLLRLPPLIIDHNATQIGPPGSEKRRGFDHFSSKLVLLSSCSSLIPVNSLCSPSTNTPTGFTAFVNIINISLPCIKG